ncbi:MAG: hypothetical protein IPP42_04430 [Saprospiraceae bacterium]|nr:hypothetical protein [Saprospiraceae bacterium]
MKIDLEELVQAQVIDQEAATRITDYYQALRKADQKIISSGWSPSSV